MTLLLSKPRNQKQLYILMSKDDKTLDLPKQRKGISFVHTYSNPVFMEFKVKYNEPDELDEIDLVEWLGVEEL